MTDRIQINHNSRCSNIEMLRLIAMFFIVTYHFCSFLKNVDVGNRYVLCGYTILHIGVPLFVLISGYFTIKLKIKKVISFYFYLLFWYIISYFFGVFIGNESFSFHEFSKQFQVISYPQGRWFVSYYFALMLLSPFVNTGLQATSVCGGGGGKKTLHRYSFIIVALSLYLFYIGLLKRSGIVNDGKSLFYFLYLYILGGYLRIISDRFINKEHKYRYGWFWVFLVIAIVLVTLFIPEQYAKPFRGLAFAYEGPILLASAILFFLFILCLQFKSHFINSISGSAFAIYLFHENTHVSWFYKDYVLYIFQNTGGITTLMLLSVFAILIMASVIIVDVFVRKPITECIVENAMRIINKIRNEKNLSFTR